MSDLVHWMVCTIVVAIILVICYYVPFILGLALAAAILGLLGYILHDIVRNGF